MSVLGEDFVRCRPVLGDPGLDSGGTRRDITRDQVGDRAPAAAHRTAPHRSATRARLRIQRYC
jgi:hypothetical protein